MYLYKFINFYFIKLYFDPQNVFSFKIYLLSFLFIKFVLGQFYTYTKIHPEHFQPPLNLVSLFTLSTTDTFTYIFLLYICCLFLLSIVLFINPLSLTRAICVVMGIQFSVEVMWAQKRAKAIGCPLPESNNTPKYSSKCRVPWPLPITDCWQNLSYVNLLQVNIGVMNTPWLRPVQTMVCHSLLPCLLSHKYFPPCFLNTPVPWRKWYQNTV